MPCRRLKNQRKTYEKQSEISHSFTVIRKPGRRASKRGSHRSAELTAKDYKVISHLGVLTEPPCIYKCKYQHFAEQKAAADRQRTPQSF
jgi:hypothetical protein